MFTFFSIATKSALTRFLDDGRLSLDNNICEQPLRDVALGRNNYLFAGRHDSGHRSAMLYSILRTCAQHEVPPVAYLTDVLRRLAHGWPKSRLEDSRTFPRTRVTPSFPGGLRAEAGDITVADISVTVITTSELRWATSRRD